MCKKNKNIATLTVILIVMLTMAACTPETIIDQPTTDPDTHGGTLIIGNINVGSTTSPTAADTRIGIDDKAFATGDKIKVFADYYDHAKPGDEGSSTYAIYTLQADGSTWELDKTVPDNDPIIVEHIMAGNTPSIESWGGMAEQPADYSYTDQSTADYYRFSDLMTSTDATLSGRTLNANMRHMNVDVVVNITDVATAALPVNATLKLKRMSGNPPEWITAWNSGTTDGITTFRACVDVTDVPGIIGDIVTDTNLLGTLTYTPADGTPTKTLNIKYSIAGGTATTIKSGMRITINVPFVDLTAVTGTATVMDWNDTDGGEVGTTELPAGPVVTATGMEPLNATVFDADNPTWVITGNAGDDSPEQKTQVLTNVKTALRLLQTASPSSFNGQFIPISDAKINLLLTGITGELAFGYFNNCASFVSINAPKATKIGDNAFEGSVNLKTIKTPMVESIGTLAFDSCRSLTTISLPAATSIGEMAFKDCYTLTRLELTGTKLITVDNSAFGYYLSQVILVLNENIKGKEETTIGVSINENIVTFLNGGSPATFTFKAIEYITITN